MDDTDQARIDALEAKVARLEAALTAATQPALPAALAADESSDVVPAADVEPDVAEAEERGRAIEQVALSRRRLLWGGGAVAAGAAGIVLSTASPAAADGAQGVTFAATGFTAVNVHDAIVELDSEKANKATLWVNARDAGCAGNGSTNDTTPLQNALNFLGSLGGGTVFLPPGQYRIEAPVTVPHGVDLWGSGGHRNPGATPATVIQAATAAAQLVFGSPAGAAGSRGGLSGNFVVDGMGVADAATGLLFLDLCVERQFTAITVVRSHRHGVVIERTQNCTFTALQISQSLQDGLVLDKGAGGNAFLRCELDGSGVTNVRIKNTPSPPPPNDYPYGGTPQHNLFLHCINERAHDSTDQYTAGMIVSGGQRNKFSHCIFSCSKDFSATSTYIVDISGGWLQFDDCSFQGHVPGIGSVTNAIRSVGGGVFFTGINWFENLTTAVQWEAAAWGELVGWFRYSNVTTPWAGAGDWTNKGFNSAFPFSATIEPAAGYGLRSSVRGEPGFRFQVLPSGQIQLNNGADFVAKAVWKLSTTDGNNGWETGNHVRLLGGALAIQTTANPPGTLLPDGRAAIYVRNNRLVVAYKPAGGSIRYKTLQLDTSSVTWVDSTTAP